MAMFKPSQSHSGGVIVNPYTGNIAQELQFLQNKKNQPHLRLGSPWQPSNDLLDANCSWARDLRKLCKLFGGHVGVQVT